MTRGVLHLLLKKTTARNGCLLASALEPISVEEHKLIDAENGALKASAARSSKIADALGAISKGNDPVPITPWQWIFERRASERELKLDFKTEVAYKRENKRRRLLREAYDGMCDADRTLFERKMESGDQNAQINRLSRPEFRHMLASHTIQGAWRNCESAQSCATGSAGSTGRSLIRSQETTTT